MKHSALFKLPKVVQCPPPIAECGGIRMLQREHITQQVVLLEINQTWYLGEINLRREGTDLYSSYSYGVHRILDQQEAIVLALSLLD